jgi:hypothetical protein
VLHHPPPIGRADAAGCVHLATCAECSEELASLAATVGTARSVTPADALVMPPPHVWEGIRGALSLSPTLDPDASATRPVPLPGAQPDELAARRARRAAAGGATAAGPRGGAWLGAAAAAGLLIGGAGGVLVAGGIGEDQGEAEGVVVAQGVLDPLPGWQAGGEAVVEETADGTRELVVTLEGGDDLQGYREVWLIDREVSRLVSLGILEGGEGRFVVPANLDLAEFPVVDVSDEPYDGDPSHSGDSIIRGLLDT